LRDVRPVALDGLDEDEQLALAVLDANAGEAQPERRAKRTA
jgi:hypothetical protein